MYWTTQKPKRDGWYWYRITPKHEPDIIRVHIFGPNSATAYGIIEYEFEVHDAKGEFSSSPIPRPKERK